jgi:hypothetical protein
VILVNANLDITKATWFLNMVTKFAKHAKQEKLNGISQHLMTRSVCGNLLENAAKLVALLRTPQEESQTILIYIVLQQ